MALAARNPKPPIQNPKIIALKSNQRARSSIYFVGLIVETRL
jgi:hypothetical protein